MRITACWVTKLLNTSGYQSRCLEPSQTQANHRIGIVRALPDKMLEIGLSKTAGEDTITHGALFHNLWFDDLRPLIHIDNSFLAIIRFYRISNQYPEDSDSEASDTSLLPLPTFEFRHSHFRRCVMALCNAGDRHTKRH